MAPLLSTEKLYNTEETMRIIILTLDEDLYLPSAFAKICHELRDDIVCIVSSPQVNTRNGKIKVLWHHFSFFGLTGSFKFAGRLLKNKFLDQVSRPCLSKKFYSLRSVAKTYDIPYYYNSNVNSQDFMKIIDGFKPDMMISISFLQIIEKKIRDQFPFGCINLHSSPLPKYRGLLPSFWVLKNGEKETAVTVHDIEEKLDNGQILGQERIEISIDETWDSLLKKTKMSGAELLVKVVHQIKDGTVQRLPNKEEEATYFSFPTTVDRKDFIASGKRFF